MELIFGYLQQGVSAIVPFVILLGLLIFVHELGHFLVAIWCGVRVEVFSLGFGKKIFQYKRGHTTYAISIVPLGGYVKMFGDEVGATLDEKDKGVSFLHKSVWKRIAIVLAGPLMNFFFAILIFTVIALSGEEARSPIVGDITPESTAHQAGLRSGDVVLSSDSKPVQTWDEFQDMMTAKIGSPITLSISRYGFADPQTITITPAAKANPNLLSLDETIGDVDGMTYQSSAAFIGVRANTFSNKFGFKTGDRITKINGNEIKYFREIEPHLLPLQGQAIQVDVERWPQVDAKDPEMIKIDLQLPKMFASIEALGFEKSDLFLAKIVPESPAEKAGLKPGDRIIQVSDKRILAWEQVLNQVKSYSGTGPLVFQIEREGTLLPLEIQPQMTTQMNASGGEEKRFTVGIVPWVAMGVPSLTKIRAEGLVSAIDRGFERTWDVTVMTVVSFLRLAQNKISPKNIGGVISIGQAASETFKIGISQFLTMMAIISVNLFILNLLPIPVLDGGHLLFYTLEAIRGAPLSMRKMEIAQQVGLVLLMSLMVFALFNDFSRIFGFH